jgi:hypothetical protein
MSVGDPAIAFVPAVPPGTTDVTTICGEWSGSKPSSNCYLFNTSQDGFWLWGQYPVETGLTTTLSFSPKVQWVLAGNYTVPNGLTTITLVQSLFQACIPNSTVPGSVPITGTSTSRTADLSSSACTPYRGASYQLNNDWVFMGTFTSTAVSSGGAALPLAVTPGQIIQVTVTITFS